MSERKPDVVVFTYETSIDYVVNLASGQVKQGAVGETSDDAHYVALFCEGEFAGEADIIGGQVVGPEPGDQELIDEAQDLLDAAFQAGTVETGPTDEQIDARIEALGEGNSNDAEIDGLIDLIRELQAARA